MKGRDSIQSLLVLRKLTRAITDVVRVQMTEYLRTLTPLMRPKALLGEYVQGGRRNRAEKRTRRSRICRRSTRWSPAPDRTTCRAI